MADFEQTVEDTLEQKKRVDTVLGIILASLLGFVLNLLANVYYGLFVVHQITWAQIDHNQIYAAGLLLIAMMGFLDFFIFDYENKIVVNRSFLKRYLNYFFYTFTPGKVIRIIVGLYIVFILVGFGVAVYLWLAHLLGYLLAALISLAVITVGYFWWRK